MVSTDERNAAFDACKKVILADIPPMFQSYVHDNLILEAVDAALLAAEKVRVEPT